MSSTETALTTTPIWPRVLWGIILTESVPNIQVSRDNYPPLQFPNSRRENGAFIELLEDSRRVLGRVEPEERQVFQEKIKQGMRPRVRVASGWRWS